MKLHFNMTRSGQIRQQITAQIYEPWLLGFIIWCAVAKEKLQYVICRNHIPTRYDRELIKNINRSESIIGPQLRQGHWVNAAKSEGFRSFFAVQPAI